MSESQHTELSVVKATQPIEELAERSETALGIEADEDGIEKTAEENEPAPTPSREDTLDVTAPNRSEGTAPATSAKKEKRQSVIAKLLAYVREKSPKKAEEDASQFGNKIEEEPAVAGAEDNAVAVADEAAAHIADDDSATSASRKPEESPKSVEEAPAKTSATSLAPKEKMGRRFSTRLGSFFGKKEAKSFEVSDVNTIETATGATIEPFEPTIEPMKASITRMPAEATSKSAESATEMKAIGTAAAPVQVIGVPAEPMQTSEDASVAVATVV